MWQKIRTTFSIWSKDTCGFLLPVPSNAAYFCSAFKDWHTSAMLCGLIRFIELIAQTPVTNLAKKTLSHAVNNGGKCYPREHLPNTLLLSLSNLKCRGFFPMILKKTRESNLFWFFSCNSACYFLECRLLVLSPWSLLQRGKTAKTPLADKSGKAQNSLCLAAPPGFITAPKRALLPTQIHKESRIF